MKSISHFILAVTLLLIVASCKKDSKEDLTPRGILTSHGWKVASMTQLNNIIPGYDYEIADCRLDDCMIFKSDGTYKTNIGSIKCNNNETEKTGTWSLSEDGNIFTLSESSAYCSMKSINPTSMILLWKYSGYEFESTYVPC